MQKIHRRKNEDILKQFQCPQNCGKAYGSYAALYTHIKTKHTNVKPPEMKAGPLKPKTPMRKQKQRIDVEKHQNHYEVIYDCNACHKVKCTCPDQMNNQDMERTIAIMSDQAFVKFVNCVGQLTIDDKFSWVRNTEHDFNFMDRETINQMVDQFNEKYLGDDQVHIRLTIKCTDFLSFSSRFWDRQHIYELYMGLFSAISKDSLQELDAFLKRSDLDNIKRMQTLRNNEWKELVDLMKAL